MPTVHVLPARPDEAPQITALGRATFTETFAADNTPEDLALFLDEAYTPGRQAAELVDPAMSTWIATVDGEAAGFAQLRRGVPEPCVQGPRPVELQRIYVLARFHGQGLAQALLQACLEQAARDGFETLWLGVWERNDRGLAFYRKMGFRPVGTHVFVVGTDPQTDCILERPIHLPSEASPHA
jgi:ribosomal protein S18 acetylase RimI-like enzyme